MLRYNPGIGSVLVIVEDCHTNPKAKRVQCLLLGNNGEQDSFHIVDKGHLSTFLDELSKKKPISQIIHV